MYSQADVFKKLNEAESVKEPHEWGYPSIYTLKNSYAPGKFGRAGTKVHVILVRTVTTVIPNPVGHNWCKPGDVWTKQSMCNTVNKAQLLPIGTEVTCEKCLAWLADVESRLHNENLKIAKLRHDNNGTLPSYAWPGGYQLYYIDKEGNALCPHCANENDSYSAELVDYDTTEGIEDGLWCDNSGTPGCMGVIEEPGENNNKEDQ